MDVLSQHELVNYASSYENACYGEGDQGFCHSEQAEWSIQNLPLNHFMHLMGSKQAWIDWLEEEVQMDAKEFNGVRQWAQILSNFKQRDDDPVVALLKDDQAYIWDGWHRVAGAIANDVEFLTVLVGRPVMEQKPALTYPAP